MWQQQASAPGRHQQIVQHEQASTARSSGEAERKCERIRLAAAQELREAKRQIAKAQQAAQVAARQVAEEQRLRQQATQDHQMALRLALEEHSTELVRKEQEFAEAVANALSVGAPPSH